MVDGMACFFQQHLADLDGARTIGDPIGIEINAFSAGVAHGGIGTSGSVQLAVATQFHREAEAVTSQLDLQRGNTLIKKGFISANGAESPLDEGVEIGLVGDSSKGLVSACQGFFPDLLGASGDTLTLLDTRTHA